MDMEFTFKPVTFHSDNPLHDLLVGLTLDPFQMLTSCKQSDVVDEAIDVIICFLEQAQEEGILSGNSVRSSSLG